MVLLSSLANRVKELKRHTLTVYFIARDQRTPFVVRALALLVAAYVLSPIDLIPDFIPVVGWLDDLLVASLGLALVLRLTPTTVVEAARLRAQKIDTRPVSYIAASAIVIIWLLFLAWIVRVSMRVV